MHASILQFTLKDLMSKNSTSSQEFAAKWMGCLPAEQKVVC